MKKVILPLLTLIIGFIAGYYFANSKNAGTAESAKLTAANFRSENAISYDEAKMLVDTFGTHGLDDANNVPGGKGVKTLSIFIPLTKLDSIVAALDAARKIDGKTDGIRFYFGRYPKMMLDGKTPYPHPYRNNIVLVSTKDTALTLRGATKPTNIHIDYFGSPNHKQAMHMLMLDPENRGELCPQNCDGAILVCPDPTNPACGG